MTISPIFAYLPNGIIREIVSYTGATYKKRNGKYMGQIPKEDARYTLLCTIPPIRTVYFNGDPNKHFNYIINLTPNRFYEVVGYHHDGEDKILYSLTMYGYEIDTPEYGRHRSPEEYGIESQLSSGIESQLSSVCRQYQYKEIIHPNANSVRSQLENVRSELGDIRVELDTIGERIKQTKRRILFCKNIAIGSTIAMFLVGNLLYQWKVRDGTKVT
jgi:hypothetical protein